METQKQASSHPETFLGYFCCINAPQRSLGNKTIQSYHDGVHGALVELRAAWPLQWTHRARGIKPIALFFEQMQPGLEVNYYISKNVHSGRGYPAPAWYNHKPCCHFCKIHLFFLILKKQLNQIEWKQGSERAAVWLVPLGAACPAASKNQAFWRLLTLNQFSLVTGMGLTAAAAAAVCVRMCVCVPEVCMFMHACTYVHVWQSWRASGKKKEKTQSEASRVCLCFPSILCCLAW